MPSYVQISPSMLSTAASFKPSLEEVIDVQRFMVPAGMLSVQVAPESADVHMLPLKTPAPSCVPSLEEAIAKKPGTSSHMDVVPA